VEETVLEKNSTAFFKDSLEIGNVSLSHALNQFEVRKQISPNFLLRKNASIWNVTLKSMGITANSYT